LKGIWKREFIGMGIKNNGMNGRFFLITFYSLLLFVAAKSNQKPLATIELALYCQSKYSRRVCFPGQYRAQTEIVATSSVFRRTC
jgi:hypothetical protein